MSTSDNPGFQTEIEFELPKGYLDETGTLHRRGVMRLATAADEILPLRDPRVQQNEAYLAIIVLARVITRLGSLPDDPHRRDRRPVRLRPRVPAAALRAVQRADDDDAGDRRRRSRSANGSLRRMTDAGGSMKAYPVKSLYEEMAFIAHHFHWSHGDLMRLEHRERRRWCREISAINRALDGAPPNPFDV